MPNVRRRLRILFLCTGNSCRSQMAEGWARARKDDVLDARSAGIEVRGVDPRAVAVMAEEGIDISGYRSKHVSELLDIELDYVITVCDHARDSCPAFPRDVPIIHRGFDDPPRLARNATTEMEALGHYRRVRDEIETFVMSLPASLPPA